MWKLPFLLSLIAFGSVATQNVELECSFLTSGSRYYCFLSNITVLDPNATVTFTGQHAANRTNDDVNTIDIAGSNTPFMIPQMFTTFSNLRFLTIRNSFLESISVPYTSTLSTLSLYGNGIRSIDFDSLYAQTELTTLNLNSNEITSIDPLAFRSLRSLESLYLIGNNLTAIENGTFSFLTNLRYLDLERNQLIRIDESTFASNARLQTVYLEYNQITEVSPRFAQNLENLGFMNMRGNQCTNGMFTFNDEMDWVHLHNSLATCFTNFNGPQEERRIGMQFSGRLTIFDEFGNIIGRVN